MTNYERIKNMSVEEMSEALEKTVRNKIQIACNICCNNNCKVGHKRACIAKIKQWLEREYREMSDKNFNEWLFADIDDLIDCDYSNESEVETE